MSNGAKHREEALDAVATSFDAYIDEVAVERSVLESEVSTLQGNLTMSQAQVASLQATVARQQGAIGLLKAELDQCRAGPRIPVAVAEYVAPLGEMLALSAVRLGQQLGRPLAPGETARIWVAGGSQLGPLHVMREEHRWWALGTLEVASQGAIASIAGRTPSDGAIRVVSNEETGGACALVLRNIRTQGSIHLQCRGGIKLQMVDSSYAVSAPALADPPVPV